MFWYPLFFILILFFSNKRKWSLRQRTKWIFFVLFVWSAIRYGQGYDYFIYTEYCIYDYRHSELLAALIETIANYTHPQVFFFITSIIIFYITSHCFCRYSKQPVLSTFFYIGYPAFFFTNISTVRQALATSLLLFAYLQFNFDREPAILRKKKVKRTGNKNLRSLFTVLCAYFFHASAVAGAFLFLPFHRIKPKIYYIGIIASLLLGNIIALLLPILFSGTYLGTKLDDYFSTAMSGHTLDKYMALLLTFVIFINERKLIRKDPVNYRYISIIYFATILLNLFSVNAHMAIRFYAFYAFPIVFLVPDLLKVLNINKLVFKLVCIFMLLFSLYFAHINIKTPEMHFWPYKSIFETSIDEVFVDTQYLRKPYY